ncbi:hypothetical protein STSP_66110 [Streptomyces jeddahensis]|uniref:Uncharacterized protein n=1 Tax=Streptomyces jeddahensis TaxID=1716141 RepID=A0A177HIL9_9ACTN|nr:hypothetical protein STSP_66110 [Streptomyces jeddahensis]
MTAEEQRRPAEATVPRPVASCAEERDFRGTDT